MLASDLSSLGKEALAQELLSPVMNRISKSELRNSAAVHCMLEYARLFAATGDLKKAFVYYTVFLWSNLRDYTVVAKSTPKHPSYRTAS